MRELEQISRGGKFTPSENYTGRKIRFLRSSTKYTHRGEAQRSRGEGEGEGIRRETSLLSTHSRCVSRWKGTDVGRKNCNFSNGRSRRQKIESCLRAPVSLPCNYHVFSRLEQPLQDVSLSRAHFSTSFYGKLFPQFSHERVTSTSPLSLVFFSSVPRQKSEGIFKFPRLHFRLCVF